MAPQGLTTIYVSRRADSRGGLEPAARDAGRKLRAAGAAVGDRIRRTRVTVLEGLQDTDAARQAALELLANPVLDETSLKNDPAAGGEFVGIEISRRPGVMDPVEASVRKGLSFLGHEVTGVRTLERLWVELPEGTSRDDLLAAARRSLANDVIEDVHLDPQPPQAPAHPRPMTQERREWVVTTATDEELLELSSTHTLSLTLPELHAIRDHFRELGREPSDIEVETLAQTWSEHCKHKTLTGLIEMREEGAEPRHIDNLLKSTIMRVTRELDHEWCWSVFADNAGVIAFDDELGIAFKVETHNHPSAIEPYGGAGTGIGGVIRDILGTGLGARPIANTDVFCFGEPDMPREDVPRGALHPRRVMEGVVAGVRDYGNRMGIPTVSGAVLFDSRYTGNPLVFCGTLGVIPRRFVDKAARPGDRIVAMGGRTGRDGIHGATFSSVELTSESETVSSGAVQIGNPITEKKVLDVLLQARDRNLYSCVTDCGAGGFSSAVGEMGEETGARVHLDRAPLKYDGLSYTEIWISEAQERMVLAVPPEHLDELLALCAAEDVEAVDLGEFTGSRRLELFHGDTQVADLSMEFVHDGLPRLMREASWSAPATQPFAWPEQIDAGEALLALLASPTVASKEWIIRQYDHEVQGGTVGKPLVGVHEDGPADAAVLLPVAGSTRAIAVSCGVHPFLGDLDPKRMGRWVVDEAVRNLVAVGAPLSRVALLDNFAWGNCARPEQLGSLVLAAEGATEAAEAFRAPFVSGKDSLNNEFAGDEGTTAVPPTLLISAVAVVPDARQTLSMDLKGSGNALFLVGVTRNELGGSELGRVLGIGGGEVPDVDLQGAVDLYRKVHEEVAAGHVRSLHDCSEGGLAVTLAEMAFAGGLGAQVTLDEIAVDAERAELVTLFAESASRFVAEIPEEHSEAFATRTGATRIGAVVDSPRLVVEHAGRTVVDLGIDELKSAWQRPLDLDAGGEA